MPVFYPAVSGDDGFFYTDLDQIILHFEYLQMGKSGGEMQFSVDLFVRFPAITIPKDASIETAYVRFIANDYGTGEPCNVNCYFNDIDDAVAPTTGAEAIALALTAAVAWDAIPYWTLGIPYYSPELKTIFQAIVNRAGWVSGNAVQIVFKNNASAGAAYRRPSAFDYLGGAEKAELHISVTTPPPPEAPSHLTLMGIGI